MSLLRHHLERWRPNVIQKGATVLESARKMTAENVGGLIVLDGDRMVGIFTERDLMKKIVAPGKDPAKVRVEEEMTSRIAVGTPDMTLEDALGVMRKAQCRHLPVVESGKLLAVVTMRDLIEIDWTDKKEDVRWMMDYIQHSP